jgi:hypothetical protein
MRLARLMTVTAVALLGAAACTTPPQGGRPLASYEVAGDTVYVDGYHSTSAQYPDLAAFAAATPVIVTGTVTAMNPRAAEYRPTAAKEGEHPGDGPDIFGTITFAVTEVLKGGPVGPHLTIVFESGKRDGRNARQRIAYQHEGLAAFQLDNGELRAPADLAGTTFVIFASPNTFHPVYREAFVLAHPMGLAQRTTGDGLRFTGSPVASAAAPQAAVTVADLRRAAR